MAMVAPDVEAKSLHGAPALPNECRAQVVGVKLYFELISSWMKTEKLTVYGKFRI